MFFLKLVWINSSKIRSKFKGSWAKQVDKAPYTPKKWGNLFIVYELDTCSGDLSTDFTLKDCLFGSIKLSKNAAHNRSKYNGYAIGFDSFSELSLPDGNMGKSVIIFGVDLSSSVHIDNREKRYLNSWKRSSTRIRWYYVICRS